MKPKFNIFLFVIVFLTISFAKAQEFDNSINSLFLVSKDLIHNGKNEIGQVQQSSNVQFLTNNNLFEKKVSFYLRVTKNPLPLHL